MICGDLKTLDETGVPCCFATFFLTGKVLDVRF